MEEEIDNERVPLRRQPVDEREKQSIIDDLMAACNSLGKLDVNDGTYMIDRDCKACLKEIVKLLNADARGHVVRQTLGSLNVVKSDLIPLLNQYCDFNDGDSDLFTLIVRLCTNLTSSVYLLFENQEIPTEPELIKVYNKLMNGLYAYKEAFANDTKIWAMLSTHLWHTEDEVPFERLLILLRNILHIPVNTSADMGMHTDFDTHSLCLYRMEQAGLFHTIIKIASETQRGREFCFHITEIVHLMLRDQNPATIAMAKANNNKRKLDDDDEDRKRLAELSARDKRDRQSVGTKFIPPRFKHSLFVVQNCRTLGENQLLTRRIINKKDEIAFDAGKTQLRKAKHRKPLSSETNSAVISDRNIKPTQVAYSLKVFSKLFVEKIYANYMQQIKHNLIQKKAAENDESYYLWAIYYFTAFNRHLFLSLDNISETMSTSTLHFIQILITGYQDKIKIEKKRCQVEKISKRLHFALRAYREILYLIKSIKQDSEFWNTIETIKKNIFTELEYNTLLLTLFQQYEEFKHCPEYLKDLIKTNDIFLELFEEYTNTHNFTEMISDDESDLEEYAQKGTLIDKQKDNLEEEKHDDVGDATEHLEKVSAELHSDIEGSDKIDELVMDSKSKQKKKKKKRKKSKKKDLRAAHFMSRYCSPEVIKAYTSVLQDFKVNESTLNLDVLKFFKRIVYDCHGEFMTLCKHLVSVFGNMMNRKRWMIQELLFWKTNNDIIEIENAVDPPPPPVAKSTINNILDDEDEPQQAPVDSLDELMIELGSDSSPCASDDEEDDNLVADQTSKSMAATLDNQTTSQKQDSLEDLMAELEDPEPMETTSSAHRVRLLSSSDESISLNNDADDDDELPKSRLVKSVFPSDSDDLSSPPSPVPSPSPDISENPVLSDSPVEMNKDVESEL